MLDALSGAVEMLGAVSGAAEMLREVSEAVVLEVIAAAAGLVLNWLTPENSRISSGRAAARRADQIGSHRLMSGDFTAVGP
jgi:hypothetical protein